MQQVRPSASTQGRHTLVTWVAVIMDTQRRWHLTSACSSPSPCSCASSGSGCALLRCLPSGWQLRRRLAASR